MMRGRRTIHLLLAVYCYAVGAVPADEASFDPAVVQVRSQRSYSKVNKKP